MDSYINYKNSGEGSAMEGFTGKPEFPIAKQSSILGLTFDELQTTFNGLGKDFGSMNMDELLKSIWSAEDTQNMPSTFSTGGEASSSFPMNGGLQKQGSLTLPRTISQKKVDDVWRDLFLENVDGNGTNVDRTKSLERRQQTLGEITLEEFLFRAGIVREDDHKPIEKSNDNVSNGVLGINFQQPILPKQTNLSFASRVGALASISPWIGNGMDMNMMEQNQIDSCPLSSSPYGYSDMRGRKRTATLEKVIERRNKRMIKNRESAARSRARKQAYTTELEEEIASLKEANKNMQKKQAEILEMQKNQMVEKMRQQWGGKRIHLKRTLTGPW